MSEQSSTFYVTGGPLRHDAVCYVVATSNLEPEKCG
jgi:hypothetical protein